jgi:hypothetical protein
MSGWWFDSTAGAPLVVQAQTGRFSSVRDVTEQSRRLGWVIFLFSGKEEDDREIEIKNKIRRGGRKRRQKGQLLVSPLFAADD